MTTILYMIISPATFPRSSIPSMNLPPCTMKSPPMVSTKLRNRVLSMGVGGRRKPIIRSLATTTATTTTTTGDRDRTPAPRGGPLPTPSDFPSWAYGPKEHFRFEVLHRSTMSSARVGRMHTPHGIVDTPGFVAVATNGALKAADFPAADASGQQLIFSNTYHLMLQPGSDIVRDAGGIHEFTGRRNGPFITDSGGFQVFSLKYGGVAESLESGGGS